MAKRIVILGGGESGVGSAILAQKKGFDVFLSDGGPVREAYRSVLESYGIVFEEKGHTTERILNADEVIKSPGINPKTPLILSLVEHGIPVISEIEFAGRYCQAQTICITGSNGKTTTTLLTYHLLKNGGFHIGLGGNVGKSFARQVAEENFDQYVLELSSFQLDDTYTFKADIALLTNITPDHLDRYDYQFEKYIDSKFRIVQNQDAACSFIYNADDPVVLAGMAKRSIASKQYPVSLSDHSSNPSYQGAFVHDDQLIIQINQNPFFMKIQELALQGKHNLFNSMAAGVAGRILELRNEVLRDSLEHFENIEHRLEFVAKVHGITFINDSKATNVNSTWYALESMDKPVIWIAGGQDKGNDYNELLALVQEKVKAIICLTKDSSKIRKAFGKSVETIVDVTSAEQAVQTAYALGHDGDAVLLSPACASFDLFENYEDRGQQFKFAVRSL